MIIAPETATPWAVPISIYYPKEDESTPVTTPTTWLFTKENNFEAVHTPYILNTRAAGYFRINYDIVNWRALTSTLKSSDLHKIEKLNRAQLIDDSMNLARAGLLPYNVALDLINYIKLEHEYIPWDSALTNLYYLRTRFSTDINRYTRRITENKVS